MAAQFMFFPILYIYVYLMVFFPFRLLSLFLATFRISRQTLWKIASPNGLWNSSKSIWYQQAPSWVFFFFFFIRQYTKTTSPWTFNRILRLIHNIYLFLCSNWELVMIFSRGSNCYCWIVISQNPKVVIYLKSHDASSFWQVKYYF